MDICGYGRVAGTLGSRDRESDDRLLVDNGKCARLLVRIRYGSKLVQANLASAWKSDGGRSELRDSRLSGKCANGLFAAADLASPACKIDVGGAELAVDVARGDSE